MSDHYEINKGALYIFLSCNTSSTGEQADFYAQPAPRPWEVMATPPNLFTNHTEEIRVPYTSSVQVIRNSHWAPSSDLNYVNLDIGHLFREFCCHCRISYI